MHGFSTLSDATSYEKKFSHDVAQIIKWLSFHSGTENMSKLSNKIKILRTKYSSNYSFPKNTFSEAKKKNKKHLHHDVSLLIPQMSETIQINLKCFLKLQNHIKNIFKVKCKS